MKFLKKAAHVIHEMFDKVGVANKNGEDHAQDRVPILLSQKERDEREVIAAKGKHNSQKVLNALILLNYNEDAPKPRTFGEQDIASGLNARVN